MPENETRTQHEKGSGPAERRRARTLALQAIYQWHVAQSDVSQILAEFVTDNDMSNVDQAYFSELVRGVTSQPGTLDQQFEAMLDRPVKDVDPIELALVRMGTFEFMHRPDVPYRVVINEGIELAKKFGGTDGHKFVNGLLDKLGRRLRPAEARAR